MLQNSIISLTFKFAYRLIPLGPLESHFFNLNNRLTDGVLLQRKMPIIISDEPQYNIGH